MSKDDNYYSLLECEPNSAPEKIKENYLRLARKFHPDKNSGQLTEKFIKIDKAWKVLGNINLRKQYDENCFRSELNDGIIIYARLRKEDLKFDENLTCSYSCRCGNEYLIHKEYLDVECILECSECSNNILIK
ncbi:hypothetical protein HHI36_010725 [Cryptolaemus montrouzieri]|uniref:J domain-containing protein n=1 Tax=Cryptolaemus montrouzieri TaxID=559131 RepID=A0ABD2MJK8_9CUCU